MKYERKTTKMKWNEIHKKVVERELRVDLKLDSDMSEWLTTESLIKDSSEQNREWLLPGTSLRC